MIKWWHFYTSSHVYALDCACGAIGQSVLCSGIYSSSDWLKRICCSHEQRRWISNHIDLEGHGAAESLPMRWMERLSDGFLDHLDLKIWCLSFQYIITEQQAYPSLAGRDAVETYCTHLAKCYQLVCQEREISQYISHPYLQIKRTICQAERWESLVRCFPFFYL